MPTIRSELRIGVDEDAATVRPARSIDCRWVIRRFRWSSLMVEIDGLPRVVADSRMVRLTRSCFAAVLFMLVVPVAAADADFQHLHNITRCGAPRFGQRCQITTQA